MELTCPRCGAKNSRETKSAQDAPCAACGGSLGGGRRRGREYDGYAVGRRLLRLAPAWLLLIFVGFALAVLLLSRMSESEGDAFKNEATNRAATPDEGERAKGPDAKAPKATAGAGAPAAASEATPSVRDAPAAQDESGAYSVQVGAFADLSQANELVSRLRAAGFEARVFESGATTRFRFHVRSGRYATREEAAALAGRLRAAGLAGETVIVEPEKR